MMFWVCLVFELLGAGFLFGLLAQAKLEERHIDDLHRWLREEMRQRAEAEAQEDYLRRQLGIDAEAPGGSYRSEGE